MAPSPAKKIPDMFFRALKRKGDVATLATTDTQCEKRTKTEENEAHGLSFSVKKGVPPPPSLKNIYKELSNDIPGFLIPNHGFLEKWATQGVFMLNATLTVESGKANSHEKIGWQKFTDKVICLISSMTEGVVFLLWGGFAHKKEGLIDRKKHAVIKVSLPL
ncbi:putative uracil-DNA glycosylase [Necator americanus]|uniref:Putative uracil-DNA glycosylase n=1 Tax=Necator americanus TaxID=51031 RepID=W2SZ35_NECAM|nr:putative uracil-DNA glycosylase [Necator americanus]ETN74970.1 putative uracil-DNA glycosylase [Necator americanus]